MQRLFSQFVLISLVFAGAAAAQTESADQLLAQAKSLYSTSGATVALPAYEIALAAYRAEQNQHGEAITLGLIGNCYKHLGDRTRALDFLQRALRLKQELHDRLEEGKTLSNIGLVCWEAGEYPKAIGYFTRAIAIARELQDRQLEATALNNLSLVYDEEGDYKKSLEQYQRALELYRAISDTQDESNTLANIGGVYLLLGHFPQAIDYYQQALDIGERMNWKPSQSQYLGNLALCEAALGRLEDSVGSFDRALVLAHETGLKKEAADWEKGKASTLLRLGRFDEALEAYQRALQAYEAAGLKRELVEALNDDGSAHLELGDRRSAEKAFRHATQVSRQISFPRGVMINTLALADLHWRSGNLELASTQAADAVQQAEKLGDLVDAASGSLVLASALRDRGHTRSALVTAQQAAATAEKSGARLVQVQALDAEAQVLLRLSRAADALQSLTTGATLLETTGDTALPWHVAFLRGQALEALKRYDEAVAAYRAAIVAIESVRSAIAEDRFRTGYLEDKQQVYVAMVRLLLRLGRIDEAFQYSERLRARGYLDMVSRSSIPPANPRLAELEARIRHLEQAIEKENSKAASDRRGNALSTFHGELAEAEREYSDLVGIRRSEAEAASAALPSSEDVARALPATQALIEYVVGPRQISIFVITRRGLHATVVPVGLLELESKIELVRDLIQHPRSDDWRPPAESLYKILISPAENAGWLRGVTELTLVPHAILNYVPFSALPRPGSKSDRFLVEDFVVSYLPAAGALFRNSTELSAREQLIALAPARSKLQYTAGEARSVAAAFGATGKAIIGSDATETSLKNVAGDYDIIHFATHGYFNRTNPLLSWVELEKDDRNDGRLEVHEILGLHLKAQLVTLSACETAMGSGYFTDIPAGDEFVGLTRAFLSAGAANVVATLWDVNDSSTAQLMSTFYKSLPEHTPAESLTIAQRQMLRTLGVHRQPYFWSAFVAVGSSGQENRARLAEKR